MVEVRTYDDVFILLDGIAAFDHSDHVFRMARRALQRQTQAEFLLVGKRKGLQYRLAERRGKDLFCGLLLACEDAVGQR